MKTGTMTLFLWLFLLFLVLLIVLDVAMLISLMAPGDERRQMIVWKSSAFTLLSTAGSLALEILVDLASGRRPGGHGERRTLCRAAGRLCREIAQSAMQKPAER